MELRSWNKELEWNRALLLVWRIPAILYTKSITIVWQWQERVGVWIIAIRPWMRPFQWQLMTT